MEIIRLKPCIFCSAGTKTVYIQYIVNDLHPVRTVVILETINSTVLIGMSYTCYLILEGNVLACTQKIDSTCGIIIALLSDAPYIAVIYSTRTLPYRSNSVIIRCDIVSVAVFTNKGDRSFVSYRF